MEKESRNHIYLFASICFHMFPIIKNVVGVKFRDVFLATEWLHRNFSYLAIILPLDFLEIFNIFRIRFFSLFFWRLKEKFSKKTFTISKLFDPTSNNFQ